MSQADDILARASGVLERSQLRQQVESGARSVGIRLRRVAVTCFAILVVAFVYGAFVSPLGIGGVLGVALMLMLAALFVGMLPTTTRVRVPDVKSLPSTPLPQLPSKTKAWLDGQKLALPAPARSLADGIGLRLAALEPQLATLDEREPAAAAVRRLIGDELPELVRGYQSVPQALRKADTDGMMPERQLLDGLSVVDSELKRMSEQLARGDLERLATQGKYLELKYSGGDV
ncbi:MAG: hypothetical protein ABI898_03970 [Sphingomonadales bacterium]